MRTHDRPRWTTLNLAALWLAVAADRDPRTRALRPGLPADPAILGAVVGVIGGADAGGEVLEAAVVCARVAGRDWASIAGDMDLDAAVVRERYADAERAFRASEAFPIRREPDGRIRRSWPAPLHNPDEWARRLAVSRGARGTADLELDDVTWRAHELAAIALMEDVVESGELPSGVDPLEARLRLERRRVDHLLNELGLPDGDAGTALDLQGALEVSMLACRVLADAVAESRRPARPLLRVTALV